MNKSIAVETWSGLKKGKANKDWKVKSFPACQYSFVNFPRDPKDQSIDVIGNNIKYIGEKYKCPFECISHRRQREISYTGTYQYACLNKREK